MSRQSSPSPKRRWLRIGLTALVLMIATVVLAVETSHFRTWHHFIWFGVHSHILQRSADIGIPGISNMYAPTASNYTAFPIQMQGCKGPSDTSPYYEITYRYQLEKWESSTGTWTKIFVMPSRCPNEDLVTTTLRPGKTMQMVEWGAIGATDGFHKGDLARFSVFTSFNESDGGPGQRIVTSPAFIIEDEQLKSDIPYRISH